MSYTEKKLRKWKGIELARAHKAWYRIISRIPEADCVEGCDLCCREAHRHAMQTWLDEQGLPIKIRRTTIKRGCSAYVCSGGCPVYERRPLICRLYGVSQSLPCDYGIRTRNPLTHEETIALMRKAYGECPIGWIGG